MTYFNISGKFELSRVRWWYGGKDRSSHTTLTRFLSPGVGHVTSNPWFTRSSKGSNRKHEVYTWEFLTFSELSHLCTRVALLSHFLSPKFTPYHMQSFAASLEERKSYWSTCFETSSEKVSLDTDSIPDRRCFLKFLHLDLALEADTRNIPPVHSEWGYTQST